MSSSSILDGLCFYEFPQNYFLQVTLNFSFDISLQIPFLLLLLLLAAMLWQLRLFFFVQLFFFWEVDTIKRHP